MAYVGRDFSPAEQSVSRTYGFDFVNDMQPSETLAAATWTLTVISGTDASPGLHLQGPPRLVTPAGSILQTATIQGIGGLLPGVTYTARADATTNLGNVLTYWSHIRGIPVL